jgi:hypothetical protein
VDAFVSEGSERTDRSDGRQQLLASFRSGGGGRILCRLLMGPIGGVRPAGASWQEEERQVEEEDRLKYSDRTPSLMRHGGWTGAKVGFRV